jgi:sec-independent protein translocase protein TatA
MGSLSIWHWVVFAVVALLLFGGRGKLSSLMGDAAKGIKAFKEGLKDEGADKKADSTLDATLPRTDKEKEDLKS